MFSLSQKIHSWPFPVNLFIFPSRNHWSAMTIYINWTWNKRWRLTFSIWISSYSTSICWKIIFPSLNYFGTAAKNQLDICADLLINLLICFLDLCVHPMPIPYCLDYCNIKVTKSGRVSFPTLFFLAILFWYFRSFALS